FLAPARVARVGHWLRKSRQNPHPSATFCHPALPAQTSEARRYFATLFATQAHSRTQRRSLITQLLQHPDKQAVMFKAVTTATTLNQLVENSGSLKDDGFAVQYIQIFKRDRLHMGAG